MRHCCKVGVSLKVGESGRMSERVTRRISESAIRLASYHFIMLYYNFMLLNNNMYKIEDIGYTIYI